MNAGGHRAEHTPHFSSLLPYTKTPLSSLEVHRNHRGATGTTAMCSLYFIGVPFDSILSQPIQSDLASCAV